MKSQAYTDYEQKIRNFVKENHKKIKHLHPNIGAVGVGFDPWNSKKVKSPEHKKSALLLYLKDINGFGSDIKEYEGFPVVVLPIESYN